MVHCHYYDTNCCSLPSGPLCYAGSLFADSFSRCLSERFRGACESSANALQISLWHVLCMVLQEISSETGVSLNTNFKQEYNWQICEWFWVTGCSLDSVKTCRRCAVDKPWRNYFRNVQCYVLWKCKKS